MNVGLCLLGTLLLRLGNSATGVLLGLLLASLHRQAGGISANTVGLMAAAFYLAELLGAPWFGAQSDRFGPRAFMMAGPIFGGLAIQLIGWPGLLPAMAIGRILEGLSTASSAPSTLSFLSAATAASPAIRARVMAWYEMATVVGIAGGFIAAGLFWDLLGHGAFLAVTAVYAGSLVAFFFVREAREPHGRTPRFRRGFAASVLAVLRQPSVLRFAPAWLLVNTVVGAWFTHSAFQLTGEERTGQYLAGALGGAGLSASYVLFGLAFLAGIYLWGMLIGARRRTTVMLLTLPGIYIVAAALGAINHLSEAEIGRVVFFLAVFVGGVVLASGFTPAALAYLADISEELPGLRGSTMGLYSVMLGLGQLGGGTLGGPFAEAAGIDGLLVLTILLATGASVTVLALRRAERSPSRLPR